MGRVIVRSDAHHLFDESADPVGPVDWIKLDKQAFRFMSAEKRVASTIVTDGNLARKGVEDSQHKNHGMTAGGQEGKCWFVRAAQGSRGAQ
jgi:hypothetical protein